MPRWLWVFFDLTFISITQNVLLLSTAVCPRSCFDQPESKRDVLHSSRSIYYSVSRTTSARMDLADAGSLLISLYSCLSPQYCDNASRMARLCNRWPLRCQSTCRAGKRQTTPMSPFKKHLTADQTNRLQIYSNRLSRTGSMEKR